MIAKIVIPPQVGIIPPAVVFVVVVIGAGEGARARTQAMACGTPPPQSVIAAAVAAVVAAAVAATAAAGAPAMVIKTIHDDRHPPPCGPHPNYHDGDSPGNYGHDGIDGFGGEVTMTPASNEGGSCLNEYSLLLNGASQKISEHKNVT